MLSGNPHFFLNSLSKPIFPIKCHRGNPALIIKICMTCMCPMLLLKLFLSAGLQIRDTHWLTVGTSLKRSEGKWAQSCQWISMSDTYSSRERFPQFPNGKILNTIAIGNYLHYPPASIFPLPCHESPGLCSPKKDRWGEGNPDWCSKHLSPRTTWAQWHTNIKN